MSLIQVADGFATREEEEAVEKTIAPLLGHLRGGSVQLKQTLEMIRHHEDVLAHLAAAGECGLVN